MINFPQNPNNHLNEPASDLHIQETEPQLNMVLPHAYKTLLKQTNGCSIGGDVLLYGTEDIAERNATWEVYQYASSYVAIGDDGGGQVLLMRLVEDEKKVWIVDAGVMDPQHAELMTGNLLKWVSEGCIIE
ncbi:SMI1/KNR4 family protein [Bacillus pumilus]|uniref:SMI1/KNR4 family protein n=1 Tax=Bacillus TaxID=1386 RepID=UPI000D0471C8|nr:MULTISPECIES: SMI1/KNR4 family protein [Bacillus]MBU5258624.1 SMI1/KNR4 family protein [Bacillus pumilus]PRS55215.1 SMI1/KNR4 family protein [Bacillus sp. GBSC66]PSB70135.1 SMI1/KNR4 family protein [Bacillus sp. LNXM12-1]PSB73845.1 SMI1/KNR4 family protein [Bacillus sp. LNXM12-2]QZD58242.1 SMI1/KNR4 family protein [Bacillus pumilus]